MIAVTRLNGSKLYVNAELIEFVEQTHDTVISLVDGKKLVVREAAPEIIEAIVAYRRQAYASRLVAQGDNR